MPTKSFSLVLALLVAALYTTAQPVHKNNLQLQSISGIGVLNGSARTTLLIQTILGVSLNKSFAGIGAGIDYYRYRSVPLFVDLRQEFGKTNRRLFVYADLGYHFDWLTENNEKQANTFGGRNDFRGGTYYDAGVGYSFILKNREAIQLSTGYTRKKLENKTTNQWCPVVGPCNGNDTYTYSLSRLVIKAAYRF